MRISTIVAADFKRYSGPAGLLEWDSQPQESPQVWPILLFVSQSRSCAHHVLTYGTHSNNRSRMDLDPGTRQIYYHMRGNRCRILYATYTWLSTELCDAHTIFRTFLIWHIGGEYYQTQGWSSATGTTYRCIEGRRGTSEEPRNTWPPTELHVSGTNLRTGLSSRAGRILKQTQWWGLLRSLTTLGARTAVVSLPSTLGNPSSAVFFTPFFTSVWSSEC